MAELSKYFPSVQEYETYVDGGNLPSNVLAVVLTEDKTDVAQISFATNDITGTFETFTCVGDQAYSELQEAYNEKVQELKEANEEIDRLEKQVDYWHDRWDTCNEELQTIDEALQGI